MSKAGTIAQAVFVVLLIAAGALRFQGIDRHDLWYDEACSYYWVRHFPDWPLAAADARHEAAIPYLLILRGWTDVFGESETAFRSLSALFGTAAVGAIGILGWRYLGRSVGLMATALAAVHPLHIHYSQEARVYAFWTLLLALLLIGLFEACRTQRRRWWFAYAVLAALATVNHLYTVFLLPVTCVIPLYWEFIRRVDGQRDEGMPSRRSRHPFGHPTLFAIPPFRSWLVVNTLLAVILIPAAIWIGSSHVGGGHGAWNRVSWIDAPPMLAIPKSIWGMLPSGGYAKWVGALTVADQYVALQFGAWASWVMRWLPAITMLAAVAIGFRSTSRPDRARPMAYGPTSTPAAGTLPPANVWLLATLTLGPLILGGLQSVITGQGYVVGRYDMVIWPVAVLLWAALISQAANRLRKIATRIVFQCGTTLLLVACSLLTLAGVGMVPPDHDISRRALAMAGQIGRQDLVISTGMYRWFLHYEWDRLNFSPETVSFPLAQDRQFGWEDPELELSDPRRLEDDLRQIVARADEAQNAGRSVWILAHGTGEGPKWEVDRQLFDGFRQRGWTLEPIDEWLGLIKLVPPMSPSHATPESDSPPHAP